MNKMRCLVCGSSHLDPQGYKCGRCGKAVGLRSEACYVNEETKNKLLDHADQLAKFGIKVEPYEPLHKGVGPADVIVVVGVVITFADSFHHGVLGDLFCYLRDDLLIPEEESLKLRLDEPEQILAYYRKKEQSKTESTQFHHPGS